MEFAADPGSFSGKTHRSYRIANWKLTPQKICYLGVPAIYRPRNIAQENNSLWSFRNALPAIQCHRDCEKSPLRPKVHLSRIICEDGWNVSQAHIIAPEGTREERDKWRERRARPRIAVGHRTAPVYQTLAARRASHQHNQGAACKGQALLSGLKKSVNVKSPPAVSRAAASRSF